MGKIVTLEAELPCLESRSFAYTGEYRRPKAGEQYLLQLDDVFQIETAMGEMGIPYPIVEPIRPRAQYGEPFFFVAPGLKCESELDYNGPEETALFSVGNYFLSKSECEYYCKEFREMFAKNASLVPETIPRWIQQAPR